MTRGREGHGESDLGGCARRPADGGRTPPVVWIRSVMRHQSGRLGVCHRAGHREDVGSWAVRATHGVYGGDLARLPLSSTSLPPWDQRSRRSTSGLPTGPFRRANVRTAGLAWAGLEPAGQAHPRITRRRGGDPRREGSAVSPRRGA